MNTVSASDGSLSIPPAALPPQAARLRQVIAAGTTHQIVQALCATADLNLTATLDEEIRLCCEHPDARVRSKAVLMLGDLLAGGTDVEAAHRLDEALVDADDRVRANAIEVLERTGRRELSELLEARGRLGRNRERANAIKALWSMKLADTTKALFEMLRDRRDAHRLSALWAVERTGHWKLVEEVARIARDDANVRVRRAAVLSVQRIAQRMRRAGGGRAVA